MRVTAGVIVSTVTGHVDYHNRLLDSFLFVLSLVLQDKDSKKKKKRSADEAEENGSPDAKKAKKKKKKSKD
jgi:hypothetical protein